MPRWKWRLETSWRFRRTWGKGAAETSESLVVRDKDEVNFWRGATPGQPGLKFSAENTKCPKPQQNIWRSRATCLIVLKKPLFLTSILCKDKKKKARFRMIVTVICAVFNKSGQITKINELLWSVVCSYSQIKFNYNRKMSSSCQKLLTFHPWPMNFRKKAYLHFEPNIMNNIFNC